jgi:hypothetical protein
MWWFGLIVLSLMLSGGEVVLSQEAAAPGKAKSDAAGAPAAKPAASAPAAKEEKKEEKAAPPAKPAAAEKAPAAPAPAAAKAPAAPYAPDAPAAPPQGPFRPLSPGAMKTVDPMRQVEETVSRHDLVEVLASDPKLDWAKGVPFRREIWALELRFKPMRMIYVDLPRPSGFMQRKQIWYLVYSVTNPGKTMRPVVAKGGAYNFEYVDKPIHFVPAFLLESVRLDKWYPDRVIPAAIGPIRLREDPNRTFYNSVEMVRDLQVGETVWGVATWEDIDPRTDRFSVYVHGLTNAYRWTDDPEKFKPGSPLGTGRHLVRKTLRLNFWRPGDEFDPKEREIRFGAPGELDYQWVYR